jgi:hypothetical protein
MNHAKYFGFKDPNPMHGFSIHPTIHGYLLATQLSLSKHSITGHGRK